MSFHPNDVARRGRKATIIVSCVTMVLLTAFFRTQVLNHSQWVMQSEENRLRQVPIIAPRGNIVDRNGQPIAESSVSYTVSVLAKGEPELIKIMNQVSELIPMTERSKRQAIERRRRDVARPTAILTNASFDQIAVLEEHRVDFPSLIIQGAPRRFYPDGPAVGAFVGYTSEITEEQLNTKADSGYRPGHQIGFTGLEQQYEETLRGQEGSRFVEVDAMNRVVKEQGARPDIKAVPGTELKTNIDMNLQRFVANIFADSLAGGAVVIEPRTGAVLAIHSNPGIDPNRFIGGAPFSYYDSLRTDERRPLHNKALQGFYAPGSTFKLATAIIGLEHNLVDWDDTFPASCGGSYFYGNRSFRCWKPEGHGRLALAAAIKNSCNVYFYQLGLEITIERLSEDGAKMGFATRTGIDLPSEKRPEWPAPLQQYMDAKWGKGGWSRASTLNLSIGQGENSQTILNMARFYAAMATDGHAPKLRVAQSADTVRTKIFNLPPDQIAKLVAAMRSVTEAGGTAAASALKGVALAGKTGTAQSGKFVNGVEQNHAWFVGFADATEGKVPTLVVAVMIEHGGHGTRAARIASAIAGYHLKAPSIWAGDAGG